MLQQHLGKPLTSIPDPFGEEKSFAHYMNRKLREFLDSFGFRYEFASSTEQYASGVFDEGLRRIMAELRRDQRAVQGNHRGGEARGVEPVLPGLRELRAGLLHARDRPRPGGVHASPTPAMRPLAGQVRVLRPHGDARASSAGGARWAGRWTGRCAGTRLGIDYEMHGEDLLDSARLSSRIVKILGGEPPELFKYELFLDEKGKKISKKIGNGISLEQWLRFAPVDSLLYLMYLKPQQAKKMGLPILPEIVDQYLELVARVRRRRRIRPCPSSPGCRRARTRAGSPAEGSSPTR